MLSLKNYIPIKTKLILILISLFCMFFVVFVFIWYRSSGDTIEKNTYNFTRPIVEQTGDYLYSYIKGLEKATLPLTLSPLINKFLDIGKDEYYDQFNIGTQIKDEIYPKLIDGRNDIILFSIISSKGIYYTNNDDVDIEMLKKAYQGSVRWNADKSFGIQGVNTEIFPGNILIFRELSYPFINGTKGTAIINLNLQQIQSFSKVKLGSTGFLWIVDWDGNYLYHPDMSKLGSKVNEQIMKNIAVGKTEYFIDEISGQNKLFVYNNSIKSGCTVICEVPMAELTGDLISMRNFSIWLTILFIIPILSIVGSYAYNLTRSMTRLRKLMKRVECGELDVRAEVDKNDEFGELNKSFNAMVSEIRRLIEVVHIAQLNEKEAQVQHREAVLHALQSQINPHFLYNVLESINSYAIIKSVMPISNMVTCLSDMFRYCVNNNKYIVTLQEEIEHVKTYLTIQTERTSELKVEYGFMDPDILNRINCTRLSLQPIVENAFIHGYEKHDLLPDYIGLNGWENHMYYELSITDKGNGMSQESVEYYNRMFLEKVHADTQQREDSRPGISIGMWNVHKRIRLTFGEPYGLFIEKSDKSGTDIRVRLPYIV